MQYIYIILLLLTIIEDERRLTILTAVDTAQQMAKVAACVAAPRVLHTFVCKTRGL